MTLYSISGYAFSHPDIAHSSSAQSPSDVAHQRIAYLAHPPRDDMPTSQGSYSPRTSPE